MFISGDRRYKVFVVSNIVVYIRNGITAEQISKIGKKDEINPEIESLWIKVTLKFTRPILIAIIYRPPSSNVSTALTILKEELYSSCPQNSHELYILGGLNINLANTKSPDYNKLNGSVSKTH